MEDSAKTIRPHKTYAKHGRAAKRGRKSYKFNSASKPDQPIKTPAITSQPVISTVKPESLKSSKGLEKIRIVRLLHSGAPAQAIALKTDISLKQCQRYIKEMEKDISDLTWKDYLSLLLSKLRLILDNHTQNSADIQLAMLDVDQTTEAQQQAIKGTTGPELKLLQAQLTRLRSERAALRAELNANNLALTTNLSKMGVTTRPPSLENKVPTQSSIGTNFTELGEVVVGYEKMDREALVEGLAESNRLVNRYLRAERERKRESE